MRMAMDKRSRMRAARYVAILFLLGLALHFFLPRFATFEESLQVARRLSVWPLLVAAVAQVLRCVVNGWMLALSVATSKERLPLRRAIAIATAASTVSLMAGGVVAFGASIYRWTRDAGARRETATIAVALPAAFNGAALLAFGLVSAAILLKRGKLGQSAALGVGIVTMLIIAAFVIAALAVFVPARWTRFPRLRTLVAMVRDAIRQGRALEMAFAALLTLAFDLLSLGCVVFAAGRRLGLDVLLGGYGVPLLLGRSSLLPGGIAVVEVAMAGCYVSLGVPAEVAVVATLVYRIFSLWLPSLAGIPIAVWLQARRPDHAA